MVSVTNIATSSLPLTNAVPQTNTVPAGGIVYYLIDVPPNAQFATNILLFASSPVNLLFSQAGFPTGTNTGDYFLLTNSMGGISLLSSNSMPTNIVPGGTYYLGVQNPAALRSILRLKLIFIRRHRSRPGASFICRSPCRRTRTLPPIFCSTPPGR